MKTSNLKLLTIVCEPVLSSSLIDLITTTGAKGFTVTDVRGEGSSQRHSGEVPESKTKIEVLATTDLSSQLMREIAAQYFNDYSIIIYSTDAQVLRAEKF